MARRAKPKKAPAWIALTERQRRLVAGRMVRTYVRVGAKASAQYNIVSPKHECLRVWPTIERTDEDGILTATLRNQFVDLARNGVRNNATLNGILHQFEVNVVGIEGGKASFDFGQEYQRDADAVRAAFARWCESAEYFDGANFNEVLRLALKTLLLGGQMAVVFDDMATGADCGRILTYEPDCIANLKDVAFAAAFPDGWTQSNGRIRNPDARWCGVICSHSQRGETEFDRDRAYILTRDPDQPSRDSFWNLLRIAWRFNQGGGKSPLTAPLGSLIDVEMLQGFEVESAKKNSQTLAQLTTNSAAESDDPSLLDTGLVEGLSQDATPEQVDDAVQDVEAAEVPTVTFDEIRAAGCLYEVMPENSKLELLDTKHPNPNMNEFIRLVACRGGWSMGMASVYTTGTVTSSYTGFRGEQLMTWPTFRAWQSYLERNLCDWALDNWARYAARRGILGGLALPDGWTRRVRWTWPRMHEVDAEKEQRAIDAGLRNGTRTYSEILGPNWRDVLRQRAEERAYMREIGLPDPSDLLGGTTITNADGRARGAEGANNEGDDNA